MRYLLDTNIIILYLRKDFACKHIDKKYNPLGLENIPIISVVTIGELKSLGMRSNWEFYHSIIINAQWRN